MRMRQFGCSTASLSHSISRIWGTPTLLIFACEETDTMLEATAFACWAMSSSIPGSAETLTESHPKPCASCASSDINAVLPDPLAPISMVDRFGSPTPFSKARIISSMTRSRPAMYRGIWPKLGVKGFRMRADISFSFHSFCILYYSFIFFHFLSLSFTLQEQYLTLLAEKAKRADRHVRPKNTESCPKACFSGEHASGPGIAGAAGSVSLTRRTGCRCTWERASGRDRRGLRARRRRRAACP